MDTKNKESEDTFLSLARSSEGLYKEKGSKFISFAYPVENDAEIKQYLESLRKKFYDARHHCYAYVLGKEGKIYRSNDDGEPNHSAGDPILGQIRSQQLSNALIVVVRYFGGIKLGVGGLIHAYREAALDAIQNNEIVQKIVRKTIDLQFDYLQMNEVMKLIKDYEAEITTQNFESNCQLSLKIRENQFQEILQKLEKLSLLQITVD
jgi:uncharacterized YigZ family protein